MNALKSAPKVLFEVTNTRISFTTPISNNQPNHNSLSAIKPPSHQTPNQPFLPNRPLPTHPNNSLKEQNMLLIDLPNSLLNPIVKLYQPSMFRVCRFIDRVIACDPGVVLVVLQSSRRSRKVSSTWGRKGGMGMTKGGTNLCQVFPDQDRTILEILEIPKQGLVNP